MNITRVTFFPQFMLNIRMSEKNYIKIATHVKIKYQKNIWE